MIGSFISSVFLLIPKVLKKKKKLNKKRHLAKISFEVMKFKKNMEWCHKNISTEGHFKLSVDMLKKSTHFFISNG